MLWALNGCLDWQKGGLGIPPEVEAATQQYRADMDTLGQFLADACRIGPELNVGATDLYTEYESWAKEQGIRRPWTQTAFGRALSERGFIKRREPGTGRNRWYGLTLRDMSDDPNYCEQLGVHTEPRVVNSLEPLFVSDNGPVNSCEDNFRLNADKIDYIEGSGN